MEQEFQLYYCAFGFMFRKSESQDAELDDINIQCDCSVCLPAWLTVPAFLIYSLFV